MNIVSVRICIIKYSQNSIRILHSVQNIAKQHIWTQQIKYMLIYCIALMVGFKLNLKHISRILG